MILLNTDGKVAMPSATSQRLRLDLKCGVPPGAEMIPDDLTGQTGFRPILATRGTIDTDGGSHNTSRGPRQKRNRARIVATLKYQELEAVATFRLAGLPARTGRSSSLSSAVTNPGCERTAGKIPRSGKLVNRTLEILIGFLISSLDGPEIRPGSKRCQEPLPERPGGCFAQRFLTPF